MGHTYTRLLAHVVFRTKDRMPWLDSELRGRLFPYMGGIVRELDAVAMIVNGPADHVHLLTALPAKLAVAELVGEVKANSSGWVHRAFPKREVFGWQTGYAAFSVSESQQSAVFRYIEGQEEHQRRRPFRDELLSLLKRHHVAYTEEYLWQ